MMAVYSRNITVADGWRQPATQLQYSRQQTHADTVMGTVLRIPYVRRVWGMADSPTLSHHQLCTAKIGRPKQDQIFIPSTKCILLVIGNFLSDKILFAQKLGKL